MTKTRKIHVVGIRGIGVSALAKVLAASGAEISGSDLEMTGHAAANVPDDADLVIYSNAVPEENPERKRAGELGIRQVSYPEALGEFCRRRKVIAVAGTNGKTTTTAMIGWIMEQAGLDPTVIVGSKVLAWNSNARVGNGEWVAIEADEYKRAFLNYEPDIAVITNIAADHLDYYRDLDDIKTAFFQFTQKIKPGGTLIFNMDDENTRGVLEKYEGEAVGFSPNGKFELMIPGEFNKANASAAAAVGSVLGISQSAVDKALAEFSGTWRRFEKVGSLDGTDIISDYAHHPDGIRVTLQTAAAKYKSVLAVFQPHQHSRTKKLFTEFVKIFCANPVQDIIIAEIFDVAGREDADQDISSQDLVREIKKCGKNVSYAPNLEDCERQIRGIGHGCKAVIIMGAGDIYKVAERVVSSK